jgi:hypothetical protein
MSGSQEAPESCPRGSLILEGMATLEAQVRQFTRRLTNGTERG